MIRQTIKNLKTILCCLFHVKGYSWFAPWVLDEVIKDMERERGDTK